MRLAFLASALVAFCTTSAQAKDAHCMARLIADVAAEEAPEQVKSKTNGAFGPITQVKVNKKSGKMTYCAENSYCYNSNAFEIVSACRIKRDTSAVDEHFFLFFTR